MIDAGFSPQQWQRVEAIYGLYANQVNHLLITHEHEDHLRGLSWWLEEMAVQSIRIWGVAEIHSHLRLPASLQHRFTPIPSDGTFSIGKVRVEAIPVVHDAVAPVAYKLQDKNSACLIATDCGKVTQKMKRALAESDQAFLSPYYEDTMLPFEESCYSAKRTASLHGHLSNQAVAAWLQESGQRLKRLILGHRHSEWNSRIQVISNVLSSLDQSVVVELH